MTQTNQKTEKMLIRAPCSVEISMRILGGKWTGSVLYHLKDEPKRFNDIAREIIGASRKVLTERLRHLEKYKLVERRVLDTAPVGVEYRITPLGLSAVEGLEVFKTWSEGLPEKVQKQCGL